MSAVRLGVAVLMVRPIVTIGREESVSIDGRRRPEGLQRSSSPSRRADNGGVRTFVTRIVRFVGPWLLVVTLVAAGTAAALGYGLTAPKRYRATAQLLVSPVSVTDPTFNGLDVLRDSGGKQTAAASAAALLRSPQVADEVRADLGLARSRDSLLHALDAHVVDSSDVVGVTIEDTSAAGSAQLANAFADALVKQRTASFQSQLATTIRRDQQLLNAIPTAQRATPRGSSSRSASPSCRAFRASPIRRSGTPARRRRPRPPRGRSCRGLRPPARSQALPSASSPRSSSCSDASAAPARRRERTL